MTQFNHEKRLALLEKENELLKQQIAEIKEQIKPNQWLTPKEVGERFNISYRSILNKINNGELRHKKDWKKRGNNRYLINLNAVTKLQ